MMISTRGRYALRVMADLAQCNPTQPVSLHSIAQRQEISEKYLESILAPLVREHLVTGHRGKGGGYRLTRSPDEYNVAEILLAAGESLSPVACQEDRPNRCPRAAKCSTLPVWEELSRRVRDYLSGVSLSSLCTANPPENALPTEPRSHLS